MLKRHKSSLTMKVFLLTFCFTVTACAVTYAAIACLTPMTYTTLLEEELELKTAALLERLGETTAEQAFGLLIRFAGDCNAELTLTDSSGMVWFDTGPQTAGEAYAWLSAGTAAEEITVTGDAFSGTEAPEAVSVGDALAIEQMTFSGDLAEGTRDSRYAFTFADGTEAELSVSGGMKAINQAMEAMYLLAPCLVALALGLALLSAWIYHAAITRPIVALSRIAGQMAAQDFGVRWQQQREDEIDALGKSLNRLSDNLSCALRQLKAANAALQGDIDREREMERQRTAFFAAASHELKTPVTILKGQLSGMLAQVGGYRDRDKTLTRSLQVTARMEALIREILTISRIEAVGYEMKKRPVHLSALVQEGLEESMELIERRGMRVEQSIMPEVWVDGSESLLSSALDNVLMNAIHYSPEGALIRVTLDSRRISVENTQAHIPEEALCHVFESFYRVEQSRSRSSGGSGLGLYLVQAIMRLHGMDCRMENTAEGVRFTAELRGEG